MKYKEVEGDLIKMANQQQFDVIAHGCNCFSLQKSGIAAQMSKEFGTDRFPNEGEHLKGTRAKLGTIESVKLYKHLPDTYKPIWQPEILDMKNYAGEKLTVVNAYTQYQPGRNLDYHALCLCLSKINNLFAGQRVGLPQIGCGIAGGNWITVKSYIKNYLKDCEVTVVIYKP